MQRSGRQPVHAAGGRFGDNTENRFTPGQAVQAQTSLFHPGEDYDRGDKFEHYKRIASLRQYVLVSDPEVQIEVWTRASGGAWEQLIESEGEQAPLVSIGASLDVSEVYAAAAEPGE